MRCEGEAWLNHLIRCTRMKMSQSHRRAFAEETLIIAREATKVKEAVAGCNSFDAGLFRIGIREHMSRSVESTNLAEL